ncbi:RNA 2',3'-cyclic phosphodiesterase [Shouchella shacheensis]|uniref:RNA 2',3'-cyclic phosphodiesterase n=1 Tax=Shouchella shacheensis TaxID=1649580 RepID=UPI00074051BE|nr:RNA 2',3'-cyclic phosphodiesterase [Shouchella shacheensis]
MNQPSYFLAIALSKEAKQAIAEELKRLDQSLFKKWVHPADFHMTLHFLGSATEEKLETYIKMCRGLTETFEPFTLTLGDEGIFGPAEKPRILWIGTKPSDTLETQQRQLTASLKNAGFSVDKRTFSPHITVARSWQREYRYQPTKLQPSVNFRVGNYTLYRSHMNATPKYESVLSFPLRGRA